MPDVSWSFAEASLGGTSHLRLPRLLQWFTGNIGFHHVHHVNPRIPNSSASSTRQKSRAAVWTGLSTGEKVRGPSL